MKQPTGASTAVVRREETAESCGIVRTITGYSYARNGNLHNATPRYIWTVTFKGRPVGVAHSYKSAVALADGFDADPEW